MSNFDKIQEHYKEISNFYKAQQIPTAQTPQATQDIKQALQNKKGQLLIKDENAKKQGLNADESLTKKENKRFEEVLEKPAQKQTQNEPTQDIDKALKAQDEPKETPSIEKESLQLDEIIPNSKGQSQGENLAKSQATNEQEPKILSEMQRIQKISLMKDLPEPTPAQQKKINTLKSMLEKRQNELKEVQDKIAKMPNAFSRFNSNNTKRAREKSLHNKKKALNLKIQDIKEQLAKIDNTMPKNKRYFADKGEVWNNSMKAQMRDLEPISDYELAKKRYWQE